MKLVYLSELRLPTKNAHGFQIMNMCSAFAEEGVEVELIVPRRFNLLKRDPFEFYRLKPTFHVTRLPAIDLYPLRFVPERISSFLLTISFLLSARVYLSFRQVDVIYTRERFASLLFSRFVYEIHMPEQMKIFGYKPRKAIVLTNHMKDELKKVGISTNDILVAPDAVDPSKFAKITMEEARKQLNLPLNKKIVMYWGNFKLWKGVDTLAVAVKYMKDYLVVMVGATKESDLARIRAMVSDRDNVVVNGFKDQELLPTYLASADVLVLPNTAKDENSLLYTSPLKLFEYMASERPIVAANLPSLKEILNDKNAVFFEPDSAISLSDTIKTLLANSELQAGIARQARIDVEGYTWSKRAKKIIDFIGQS